MRSVVIVDYGMGNLWSVQAAFSRLGVVTHIAADPGVVESADCLVLPGVGSFRRAMEQLRARRLDVALKSAVDGRRCKILGICLGMQLLAQAGVEDGPAEGLGLIQGQVQPLEGQLPGGLKVPHIGFNAVHAPPIGNLFKGIEDASDFYFVHSYHLVPDAHPERFGCVDYGLRLAATYEHANVFATQFHPEKSQTNGLRLLRNFLDA
jgi:glutamine amidotransferase